MRLYPLFETALSDVVMELRVWRSGHIDLQCVREIVCVRKVKVLCHIDILKYCNVSIVRWRQLNLVPALCPALSIV